MISQATRKKKGFTLIEVTLAIVIGIVMIAGATLIYNQAKNSAGNSRASSKVVGLQQVIEEFAAQNQGIYPTSLRDINDLWIRKRPDDWNKSPWGGVIGSSLNPNSAHTNYAADYTAANAGGVAVLTMSAAAGATGVDGTRATTASTIALDAAAALAANPSGYSGATALHAGAKPVAGFSTTQSDNLIGALVYISDSANSRIVVQNDQVTNSSVYLKGYACFTADAVGRWPNFTVGAKPNN
ncbi:MAG: type II secretion system protein [Candidatus Sericytochromatia bacterium]|nr:type II secretion system protein [Candidatus Sericytochromatia bacterium]